MANRRPGGVAAPQLARRGSPSPIGTAFDWVSGEGDAAANVAQSLRRMSVQIGDRLDAAAARDGEREGALAGLDAEFRPREDDTIRGRAYNAAAIRSYTAHLETDVRRRLDELALTHRDDPLALNNALASYRQEVRSARVFADIAPDFEQMFDRAVLPYQRDAARQEISRQTASHRAAVEDQLQERFNLLDRMARSAGLDAAADAAIGEEIASLSDLLVASGPRGAFTLNGREYEADENRAGALTVEQINAQLNAAATNVEGGRILGAFERLGDLDAMRQFRDEFQGDWQEGRYGQLDATAFDRLASRMDTGITRAQTQRNAQLREIERGLDRQAASIDRVLDGYEDVAQAGLPVADDDLQRIFLEASSLGTLEGDLLAERAQEIHSDVQIQTAALRAPLAALESAIIETRAAAQADGLASPEDARRISNLETAYSRARTALNEDPIRYAQTAGLVDELPRPDFADPESAVSALAGRRAIVEEIAGHYGVAPRYFTRSERDALGAAVDSGNVSALAVSQIVVSGYGDAAPDALREIAGDQPILAHLGGLLLVNDRNPAAIDAQAGFSLAQEEGFDSRIDRALRDELTGPAEQLARWLPGETPGLIRRTADAIYETQARRQGITEFDGALYERALNSAAGAQYVGDRQYGGFVQSGRDRNIGVGRVNAVTVVAPSWLRADRFNAVIDGLDEYGADVSPMFDSSGRVLPFSDLRRAWLTPGPGGPGRYYVTFGEPDSPQARMPVDQDGEPYVLDLEPFRESIAAAHDDWVLP